MAEYEYNPEPQPEPKLVVYPAVGDNFRPLSSAETLEIVPAFLRALEDMAEKGWG